MAVVAGGGAEEFDDRFLRPRALGTAQSVGVCLGDQIVHQRQARVAADKNLLGLCPQQLGKQALCRRKSADLAVVAHVKRVVEAVRRVGQHGQDAAHKVELLTRGLATRHVKIQMQRLAAIEFFQQRGIFRPPLLRCKQFVRFHTIRILSVKICCFRLPR